MTSLAFVLGVLPLVFATGAGAAARRSMGTGVFGGMLAATFVATIFVPLFFVLLDWRRRRATTPLAPRRGGDDMSAKPARRCAHSPPARTARVSAPVTLRRRRLASCSAGAAAAGCMVGPDYQRPAVDLPGRLSGRARPTSAAADRRAQRLVDAVRRPGARRARRRRRSRDNTDVHDAVARIEEADANLREVDAALFPEIDLNGAAVRAARELRGARCRRPRPCRRVRNDVRLALSPSYEIDFWGKLRRGSEAARAQALGSRYAKDVVDALARRPDDAGVFLAALARRADRD